MSDSALSDKQSSEPQSSTIDDLSHLQRPTTTNRSEERRRSDDPQSVDRLREELDLIHMRLLTAVDAVAGAEAERSAAQARIRELEHQHHMLEVERDELRREIELLGARAPGVAGRVTGRLYSLARSHGVGRR